MHIAKDGALVVKFATCRDPNLAEGAGMFPLLVQIGDERNDGRWVGLDHIADRSNAHLGRAQILWHDLPSHDDVALRAWGWQWQSFARWSHPPTLHARSHSTFFIGLPWAALPIRRLGTACPPTFDRRGHWLAFVVEWNDNKNMNTPSPPFAARHRAGIRLGLK